jgi:hypothetical protein
MFRLTLFAGAIVIGLAIATGAVAGDAKIYGATGCSEAGGTQQFLTRHSDSFENHTPFEWLYVLCPVLKQHPDRGVSYAHAHVQGEGVACFLYRLGPAVAYTPSVVSPSAGHQTLGLPGFARVSDNDSYVLGCRLPPGTSFFSYRVSE